MKPGTRVKTPNGEGCYLRKGKKNEGSLLGDCRGKILVMLDEDIGCHWNFFFDESEVFEVPEVILKAD